MKILVIDAYNMIHRARFGYVRGEHAITFNFFRALKSEIVRHDADKVYIVSEGKPKHRLEINTDYKGQRSPVKDKGFHRQKREIFDICKSLPVTYIQHPDYECDDVIGFLCTKIHTKEDVTIVSSDSDFIQLLNSENIQLWNPVKKSYIEKWPVDYVTWKALKGDPTDNIPGIRGVGEKRAYAICESSSTLNNFLVDDESRKITFEAAYAQIKLADIDEKCVKWNIKNYVFDENLVLNAFTDRGFKSIIGKSWQNWTQTMEKLNNVRNECDLN